MDVLWSYSISVTYFSHGNRAYIDIKVTVQIFVPRREPFCRFYALGSFFITIQPICTLSERFTVLLKYGLS